MPLVEGTVSDEELVDAILLVSRAMVGVATRSLTAADNEITLPQYRALVVLVYGGAERLADLATTLAVSPSTATRMCDRLVRKGLVTRDRDALDRREVNLEVTEEGRRLVEKVMERRRQEVRSMTESIPARARARLVSSLQLLAQAAGEVPDLHWAPGWREDAPAPGRRPVGTDTAPENGAPGTDGVRSPSAS